MDRESEQDRIEGTENKDTNLDTWNAKLQFLDEKCKSARNSIDEMIKQFKGNDKYILEVSKTIHEMVCENTQTTIILFYIVDRLQKRDNALEAMIKEIANKTKTDISKMQEEIEKYKLPKPVQQWANELRKEWNDTKVLRKKFFKERW